MTLVENADRAHVKRVTLNLLRHAACCPDELRGILAELAGLEWDLSRLDPAQVSEVYAEVTPELAARARDEFSADLGTVVSHRGCDATCRLCGQPYIRFEFLLRNRSGGVDVWTGSDCIETYGLRVDGTVAGEEALKALRQAIARARRKDDRDDWQNEHPDHAIDMGYLAELDDRRNRRLADWYSSAALRATLRAGWGTDDRNLRRQARPIVRYYEREGFLTPTRTREVYGAGSLLARAKAHINEYRTAKAATTDRSHP